MLFICRIFSLILLPLFLFSNEFVLFTQPKTGTHLLKPILTDLVGKEAYSALGYHDRVEEAWALNEKRGSFLHLHAPYNRKKEQFLAARNCTVFFVKRDPRDQIVSLLNHNKYIRCLDQSINAFQTDDDKLMYMIKNHMRSQALSFLGWLRSPIACIVDFSHLMGENGGVATQSDAMREMRKIADALNVEISDSSLEEIYFRHFGTGGSFFRGKVGAWRNYFNESHKAAAKKEVGSLLIKLGFEKDYNW